MNTITKRLRLSLIVTCSFLALALLVPTVRTLALVNIAQMARLHQRDSSNLFVQALVSAPANAHVRWQTGAALYRSGETAEAAETLQALDDASLQAPLVVADLFDSLLASGQLDKAFELYQTRNGLLSAPRRAAALALAELSAGDSTKERGRTLLPEALAGCSLTRYIASGDRSKLYQRSELVSLLARQLARQSELAYDDGILSEQRLQTTLAWRAGEVQEPNGREPEVTPILQIPLEPVAQSMGLTVEDLALGPELLTNGSFEQWDASCNVPEGWQPWLFTFDGTEGTPADVMFASGTDPSQAYHGQRSLRIDGIPVSAVNTLRETSGLWHGPLMLEPGQAYLISFAYRTENLKGQEAQIWFTEDLLFFNELDLPSTSGAWHTVQIVAWNRHTEPLLIRPLLRSNGAGTVWFDALSLRLLEIKRPIVPQAPIILLSGTP